MEFEGSKTLALLDTGSPVTIVSLEFAIRSSEKNGQQVEEWKKEVRAHLESPMVKLRNYGGGELNIAGQMRVRAHLSRGKHALEGVVQIQKGAPVDLLVGTDAQPQLGFLFLDTSLGWGIQPLIYSTARSGACLSPKLWQPLLLKQLALSSQW